jgi:hypothetical protein
MLRSAVLGFAIVVLLVCVLSVAMGKIGAWVPIVWSLIVVAAIAFERFRYKPLAQQLPGPGWEKTAERFVDDETGKTVTVYINRQTGERQYVQD